MYQLLTKAKDSIQSYTISGTIGNKSFTRDNVISGSLTVSNQCCDTSTFGLGGVYIGEMTAIFTGINISRNNWIGKEISFEVTVNESDSIPCGVFVVYSATHQDGYVSIKAYDKMSKFDKAASISPGSSGSAYEFLSLACEECGVILGMTNNQVKALPNGNKPFALKELGDITTWRDLIYWISVSLGGYATMNRSGELVLRTYHSSIDDTMPADMRFNSDYGDEVITYTGLYAVDEENQVAEYYHAEPDDGYTISVGTNPFFQVSRAQREIYCENLVAALQNISYNSCAVSIPFGCHYDLGDVLQFPNGSGSATNKFCIVYYSWTYGGECKIKGIPKPKDTSSKADKNIQGLLSNTKRNETASYEQKNTKVIDIADNERKNIVSMRIASNTNTKAMIHIEVNLESLANTPTAKYALDSNKVVLSDIWDGIKNTAVKGEITYIVNSVEDELHPIESWIDGNHVLHLMYILGLTQGIVAYFDAYMRAIGGSIHIDRGGVWTYALGVGLVGDGKWDGTIEIEEVAEEFSLIEIILDGNGEVISIDTQVPSGVPVSDVADDFSIPEVTVETIGEVITFTFHQYSVPLLVESGEYLISEGGDVFYTEGD